MPDALAIITMVISEHRNIREHVKLAGDTISDIEALLTLQKAQAAWSQSSIEALEEKQNRLQQAISFLDEGLRNHFNYEEKTLPPLFGDLLMKSILHEHHEISRQIEDAKTNLNTIKLEGSGLQELLSKKEQMQEITSNICQAVEEHAHHEEIILSMMKKALEVSG